MQYASNSRNRCRKHRRVVTPRKGNAPRTQEKREIILYCILILSKQFNVNDEFTNSQIKGYLKGELEIAFKGKSIEWNKSILARFIDDTGKTKKVKTKPEKVYKLIKKIPSSMEKKAIEAVGIDWLEA